MKTIDVVLIVLAVINFQAGNDMLAWLLLIAALV